MARSVAKRATVPDVRFPFSGAIYSTANATKPDSQETTEQFRDNGL